MLLRDVWKRHTDRCSGQARNQSSMRPRKRVRIIPIVLHDEPPAWGNDSPQMDGVGPVVDTVVDTLEIGDVEIPIDPLTYVPIYKFQKVLY